MTVNLLVWEFLCAALFWSVFCRCVRMDRTTRLDIRIAVLLVGMGALIGLGAPVYGWQPDIVTLLITSSVVVLQIVTSQRWGRGVPDQFVARRFLTRTRRSGDKL